MDFRLGIDIGGTKANIGLFYSDGKPVSQQKMIIPENKSCPHVLKAIAGVVEGMLTKEGIAQDCIVFCGMGVPGTVDETRTVVLSAPNLHWEVESCTDIFYAVCGIRPELVQDTRAAALGESIFGGGKGSRLLVCVTLGTGIGAGIVYNGEIFNGAMGGAGEVGHIPVVPEGRLCSCGRRGCMETYASGSGIARIAQEHPGFHRDITSKDVFAFASMGNTDAKQIIAQAANCLGQALTSVINILSPDTILFSGGMCTQKELYINPVIEYLRSHAYSLSLVKGFHIGTAILGEDAPMIGAAMLNANRRVL